ncbi:MAG: DUF1481 domain-containing protein [Pantoea sp.]|jgi:hypothetical protein|uniref:DUF1481 domain-containing protein n=1 Tax=Pantoea sp. TaxID=69393 RepID=UPI000ED5F8C7|nr:DUF1481 domain-containing protein [Pantoea sp.]MDU6079982.1 DUF1481 domain-containing protein [Pantoea sp.]MDU7840666.1 DUF1481 domain-containing protein [Pantoea sp.]HAB26044.1 DUF1481 domain-containing protein [Pantoea sp.]
MPNLRLPSCFALLALLLLSGCGSTPDTPPFSASGYLADRGAVRIWRKNSHLTIHLRTLYTPFNGDAAETTDYVWQEEKLVSVARHVSGKQPDDVTLRFDQDGSLSFMQRQLAGRREAVDPDTVELYKFDAQRMLAQSNALLSGRVMLKQGQWLGAKQIALCDGGRESPSFDDYALQTLAQQQRRSATPLLVSWLEAPEGTQLLRAAPGESCDSQPKEEDF